MPLAVRVTPARPRLNMRNPMFRSTSLMALDRLGWEMNSDFAASVIDPFSTTAIRYRNCCSVTMNRPFAHVFSVTSVL